ncbi:MAG: BrnT family toxin [Coriobacteriales bacterium]|jgi:uncharacterized DUF497 family protein|nr:BrnT family toxin [Coriobacteriales bacterium]
MGGRGGITSQAAQGHDAEPKFEYDPAKSATNKEKHGIDFEEAKALWRDEKRISFPSKYENELRYINIAKYNERHYAAVTTIRGNNIKNHICSQSKK